MIKNRIKKILSHDTNPVCSGSEKKEHYSKALKRLVENYQELEEEKIIITKEKKENPFDKKVRKIVEGYDLVNFEIEKYGQDSISSPKESLSSGDAYRYKPFPLCIQEILYNYLANNLQVYPSTVGSSKARQDLVYYLVREGFPKEDNEYCSGINVHNVAFASSTTQAFVMILKIIAKEKDTIIVPAPTYGIFVEVAEKLGIHVESIDLKEENNFFLSPKDLKEKIISTNERLQEENKGKDYIPKVVAYLNINPHNPIGNVLTKEDLPILKEMGDICLEEGVFIIDDLIYRDLTYDRDHLAFPIASIPKYFNNTISLFGLSKSYGLASYRAGFIVMPTPIFWGYATEMFDLMDSISVLQVEAVRGAYNGSNKRYRTYQKYFATLIPKYLYQLQLTKALVEGIHSIEDSKTKEKIIKDIKQFTEDESLRKDLFQGIENVSIRKNTYPKSGFFVLLDFTSLKGKYYNNKKISTEYDLLKAIYHFGKVRYLMGENIMWPNEEEWIARVNFAIDKMSLIDNFSRINHFVKELKDEKETI